mmetsp:Transcript_11366/g.37594  ORF Transcript_11366/g.37594 Transcript_11366/m.37594 type:complete len:595 (-) Transcript_11366:363-2147(-)
MHEQRRHHGVGRLLLEDLVLEVRHASVRPSEGLVREDADRGGRRRDTGRDDGAALELDHRAPVLHPLGQRIVRPLRHRQPVNVLDELAALRLHRRVEVGDEQLAARKRVGELLEPERAEAGAVVVARRSVGRVGADVDVGGRAQERDAGGGACGAEPPDAVVRAERQLDVELAVEVGVVADHHLCAVGQGLLPLAEPVCDLARLLHQVAAGGLIELLVGGALRLRLGEREDERSRRASRRVAEAPPHTGGRARAALAPRAGDVDGDDRRAHLHQLWEGPHRRAGADHHDVHVLQALAFVKVVGEPAERLRRVRLDDAARRPLRRLRLERLAAQAVRRAGRRRARPRRVPPSVVWHPVARRGRLLAAAHRARLERAGHLVDGCSEGAAQRLVRGVVHHVLVHPPQPRLRRAEAGGGRLAREADELGDVLIVPEAPAPLAGALCRRRLRLADAAAADGCRERLLARLRSRAAALAVLGELGPHRRLWRRRRLCEPLLEGTLAVLDHVHVHEGRRRDVEHEHRLDEQRREAAKGRREGRIGEAGEEGEDLPGDAGRVEDGKEGVAEPEDGVEGARLPARPDQVVEVEGVPRHLDQRP